MQKQDLSRYYQEDVEAIEGYTPRQLERVLLEFGYDEFPSGGINDEGFRKLRDMLSEIDDAESRLEKPRRRKKRDLGSEVENERNQGYLSVVRRDLRRRGRSLKKIRKALPIVGVSFAIPTISRRYSEGYYNDIDPKAVVVTRWGTLSGLILILYYLGGFIAGDLKQTAIVLGVHVGSNIASKTYEYARNVRKRAREGSKEE